MLSSTDTLSLFVWDLERVSEDDWRQSVLHDSSTDTSNELLVADRRLRHALRRNSGPENHPAGSQPEDTLGGLVWRLATAL